MLKLLFVLEVFTYFFRLSCFKENALINKLMPISKFMMSQTGPKLFTIHILSNISRSKCSQAIKLGWLINYNIKNIFLEK